MRWARPRNDRGPAAVHPVLLALLRPSTEIDDRARFAKILPGEWAGIEQQAAAQRLTGILYARIHAAGLGSQIPPAVLAILTDRLRGQVARALALNRELTEILRLCAAQRLRCVPLRGAAVASWLHPDPTLRPMDDLDVLVPRDDLPAFVRILAPLGYEPVDHRPSFAEDFYYSLELFASRTGGVLLEPHWTIAYPPFCRHLDMAPIWDRCTSRPLLGVASWALDHTDLVFHLCLHLAHKRTVAPLLWWAELDHATRVQTIDWDRLDRQAAESGQQALVADVLRTLNRVCGTPLPEPFSRHQNRATISFSDQLLTGSTLIGREQFATLLSLPGLALKARYALGLLFPSPAFMRQRYGLRHPAALCVYYPVRIVSLLWEGLKGLGVIASLSGSWRADRST